MSGIKLTQQPNVPSIKDATHVPVVSAICTSPVRPGVSVDLSVQDGKTYAVPARRGVGVVNPFLPGVVAQGDLVWVLVRLDAIYDVRHTWDLIDTSDEDDAAERAMTEVKRYVEQPVPSYLVEMAERFRTTPSELLDYGREAMSSGQPAEYQGSLTSEEFAAACKEQAPHQWQWESFWYYYADMTGHEFPEFGDSCCPDTEYPEYPPFVFGSDVDVDSDPDSWCSIC